jgi:aryl-alcohol dehydrogenase-like predicted oxidoreductase
MAWIHALSRQELIDGVHDNVRNLGLDALDVVNLRVGGITEPSEGSIEEQVTVLSELKRQGLIRHIGLSNVTPAQLAEAQRITEIVCIQNFYNVAQRNDDGFIDNLAEQGIAYVPFFPLGGFTPLQVHKTGHRGSITGSCTDAGRARLAPSAFTQHPVDPRYIFFGTPSGKSQRRDAKTLGGADR